MVDCEKCKNNKYCNDCKQGEKFEWIVKPQKSIAPISKLGGYYCPHCKYKMIKNGVCERCGAELIDENGNAFTQ